MLTVRFEDHELPDLSRLLLRALNTWEPANQPPWALELADRVCGRLEKLAHLSDVALAGPQSVGDGVGVVGELDKSFSSRDVKDCDGGGSIISDAGSGS